MSKAAKGTPRNATAADRTTKPPKRKAGTFKRDMLTIDRSQEFFSEDELSKQIGHARPYWPAALMKELVDNGLTAAEDSGRAPAVTVTVGTDRLVVADNGDGIAPETVAASLDYTTRTTDKAVYVSPTRGRQGNALKTLWAAPYVVSDAGRGVAVVEARGRRHTVTVSNNLLAGKPEITHRGSHIPETHGTRFELRWPGVAADLTPAVLNDLDSADDVRSWSDEELTLGMRSAETLARAYALFNPHAAFRLDRPDRPPLDLPARGVGFQKWLATDPIPPQWYTPAQFESLLAALVQADRLAGRRPRSVREVLATFRGLTGTPKQKAVCAEAGIAPSTTIADLFPGDRPNRRAVRQLHAAAAKAARPVAAKELGVFGEALFTDGLRSLFGASQAVKYRKVAKFVGDIPFVIEVAFGVSMSDVCRRQAVTGVNWSPALRIPFEGLADALQDNRVDDTDPAVIAVHLAYPGATATDRGKSRYDLPGIIRDELTKAVADVTREWRKAKAGWERDDRRQDKEKLDDLRRGVRTAKQRIADAACEVMPEAYAHASGGLGIAAARQVMYSARALIIERFGIDCVWKDSKYFTQTLLPRYLTDNPRSTANWDVVFDDRGHFLEPHTGHRIGIGTVSVRGYIDEWSQPDPKGKMTAFQLDHAYPTRGPRGRFRNVLFVEKQGFDHILHRARIQERFDVALMSTKGMTVVAARRLIDRLSADGVTMHVLHDFDKAGLGILHTMRTSNHRYRFSAKPRTVDLGLRLGDVTRLGLMSEAVRYEKTRKDPRERLAKYKASVAEQNYLVRRQLTERTWEGERVELNAMTSDQIVHFLEAKFAEHGIGKVVPDAATAGDAYQRAARIVRVQSAINAAVSDANLVTVPVPDGITDAIASYLREHPDAPWDEAVYRIAEERAR